MKLHITRFTIDKGKYVIIPQAEFIAWQKAAAKKIIYSQKLNSLSEGENQYENRIDWLR